MAKKPLPLGTWGQIWTKPVHHDAKGRPDMFQARAHYRDFDGRTRDVTARGKTKTEAANSLRSFLKERVKLRGFPATQVERSHLIGRQVVHGELTGPCG
jgi:hypothetical protein